MRGLVSQLVCFTALLLGSVTSTAQTTVIDNVLVFDGKAVVTGEPMSIVISGNTIASVGDADGVGIVSERIDGGGRWLIPGLIDGHAHLSIIAAPHELQQLSWDEIGARMAVRATDTLMRGFTSVRDLGGPTMGLKKAVDDGAVAGPRIYPSGALISQTSGHGDFRRAGDRHPLQVRASDRRYVP